jgi:hypothetical protein
MLAERFEQGVREKQRAVEIDGERYRRVRFRARSNCGCRIAIGVARAAVSQGSVLQAERGDDRKL